MNGFLILARCGMDDVPMRLCESMADACEFARSLTTKDVQEAAETVCGVSVSEVITLHVVEFHDGVPLPVESVPFLEVDDND
jgi:hypothetical protein